MKKNGMLVCQITFEAMTDLEALFKRTEVVAIGVYDSHEEN